VGVGREGVPHCGKLDYGPRRRCFAGDGLILGKGEVEGWGNLHGSGKTQQRGAIKGYGGRSI